MEVGSQDPEIGMPSSLGYNPPKRDSSSKIPSGSKISAFEGRIRDHQTATPRTHEQRQHHPLHHHAHVNLHHQILKPIIDPDLIPDPAPAPAPTPAPAPAPILPPSSINKAPTPNSRSMSRSPPPASTFSTTASAPSVRYRECLKNHAASMGGTAVDGCGEFMPSGQEGTPEAMKCAACECHRNFHRKEIDGESQCAANYYYKISRQRTNTFPPSHHQLITSSLGQAQTPVQQRHKYPHGFPFTAVTAPAMMTFGGGGAVAESSSEDLNIFQSNLQGQGSMQRLRKRFRTKFSQEQKDKMIEFAERLEWRMQKQDEQEVQKFCSQVGVKRKVFKVWMHNNKQAMKKKQM